jgi:hypothetical protein
LQRTPLLVVTTGRDRKQFVADVPAIMRLLDPTSTADQLTAITFEGSFFEAEDDHGPFVSVENAYRGEVEGGEWSVEPPASTPIRTPNRSQSLLGNQCIVVRRNGCCG